MDASRARLLAPGSVVRADWSAISNRLDWAGCGISGLPVDGAPRFTATRQLEALVASLETQHGKIVGRSSGCDIDRRRGDLIDVITIKFEDSYLATLERQSPTKVWSERGAPESPDATPESEPWWPKSGCRVG